MNRRERLQRAYAHQELDRPAVYSRTAYPANDPTYDRLKAYLAEHSELKGNWNGRSVESAYETHVRLDPHSADFDNQVTTLRTSQGDLETTRLVSRRGQPGLDQTYYIKDRADAERYLSLPMPEVGGDVSGYFAEEARIGDAGIVNVALGFGPGGFVNHLCGSQTFAILSVTDRDILHALCERQMEIMLRTIRYLVAQGVGPYWGLAGEEQITPPLHGPADFRDFVVRYEKPIIDLIHDAGGRVHIHCHGSIKKVLPMFVEMGVDVLHPFEAPTMGDVTPQEAKALAGEAICLEGNLQIHHLYEHRPEEIAAETAALIDATFGDRKNLIVSSTASPYIRGLGEECLANYKAMVDTVLGWKA